MKSAHQSYLQSCVAALRLEIAAVRATAGAPIRLERGERIAEDSFGAAYRFSLVDDSNIPEGTAGRVETGSGSWDADVLRRDGMTLILFVRHGEHGLPPAQVPTASLRSDLSYLLEALIADLERLLNAGGVSQPTASLLDRLTGDAGRESAAAVSPTTGDRLNPEQAAAVEACATKQLHFVWGPPGTGKTATLGHLVSTLASGGTALVVAHTNVAVDAALLAFCRAPQSERQLPRGSVVRAGVSALDAARAFKVDTRSLALERLPGSAAELSRLAEQLDAGRATNLRDLVRRYNQLLTEVRSAEELILGEARVVFATMSKMLTSGALAARDFDSVIVDEVSIAYPPQVVAAASRARTRVALFGDFKQLPPIVISDEPLAETILGQDCFTAAGIDRNRNGLTMLREQYRMHPAIRTVVSNFAYDGLLRDGDGTAARTDPIAAGQPFPERAVTWCEIGAVGSKRFSDATRSSRFNPVSALTSFRIAASLRDSLDQVIIITPYRPQARLLNALVNDAGIDGITVGTINRFQGGEAPGVVLDLVEGTGNAAGRPLHGSKGERLLNVAMSRAIGKLVIVGRRDMPTTSMSPSSGDLVRRLSAGGTHLPLPWSWERHGFAMDIRKGFSHSDFKAEDVVAGWLPDSLPSNLRTLSVPHAELWSAGHPMFVLHEGAIRFFANGSDGSWTGYRVDQSPRFAQALAELISGTQLGRSSSPRRNTAPTAAVRHDRCHRCGSEAVPNVLESGHLDVVCRSCGARREATKREIEAWVAELQPTCPECERLQKARYGRSWFLGCSGWPDCDGTSNIDELEYLASRPRKPRVQQASSKRTRTTKAAPREQMCRSCFLLVRVEQLDERGICQSCG